MTPRLGPLELVGDRWVIGDPARKDGLCVELTPEGLEHHRRGETAPQLVLPWSRFVELKVRAAYVRWHATPAGGFVGAFAPGADMGRDCCSLYGILRHPYELWKVRYTHHERRYAAGHAIVLKALFDQLTEARALDRLGDPEWLGAAVAKLSPYTSWYAPKGDRLVEATIRSLGT
ncbi:hypothetical protein QQM39_21320 [Streptomyces sp. DT2A-34]|uniref:hypothetical protein n=1 Tax=Streptomyces sp. DT2A-34 TaxID=3051182 RepID=UPI00265B9D59|nr:hypothetical protein [Streptomyces sp. DT2A-34]MDO0913294.1 hypothetical protein [Streptomyces sp. DT2A-34]